jgi:hypothetical protein
MHLAGQRFGNSIHGLVAAAVTIQKTFRKWTRRKLHVISLEHLAAATVLQRSWRARTICRNFRAEIKRRYKEEDVKGCIRMMNTLKRDRALIYKKGNKRLIVQITNWRHKTQQLSLPDLDFGRCAPLQDPDVAMVFIVPCMPDKSKLGVFSELLSNVTWCSSNRCIY